MFSWFKKRAMELKENPVARTFVMRPGQPAWSGRSYEKFAIEAYERNSTAYGCIRKVATAVSSVPLIVRTIDAKGKEIDMADNHPLMRLLYRPTLNSSGKEFIETIASFLMISGNAYISRAGSLDGKITNELWALRPDRMQVIEGKSGYPEGYMYKAAKGEVRFPFNPISGKCDVLHLKYFHPTNDWYGLSAVEPGAYNIDILNQIATMNKALLDNSCVPSGVIQAENALTDEQFARVKQQISEDYSGTRQAGKPIVLDNGMSWTQMGTNPKDMEFLENRRENSRAVALAFGVPPQVLGIPGDSTFSNMEQAKLALWEETVIPMLTAILDALNNWLAPMFGPDLYITYDKDSISALEPRRKELFERMQKAMWLTKNEKRIATGYEELPIDFLKVESDELPTSDIEDYLDARIKPDKAPKPDGEEDEE